MSARERALLESLARDMDATLPELVREAIELRLALAEDYTAPWLTQAAGLDGDTTTTLGVRVPKELVAQLGQRATAAGVSRSTFIREGIALRFGTGWNGRDP